MPAEGLVWLPKHEILTFEELTRLLGLFVHRLEIRSVKVTGGEPTVRADLPELIRMFRTSAPEIDLSMTTNGVLLERLAAPLAQAGLDRVTVSLDSLLRHRFEQMTRRDALDRVLAGIAAAEEAGLVPIKINCVVIGGTNDDELVDLARWSRERGHVVRFIEYMPLDAQHAWERAKVFPSARIVGGVPVSPRPRGNRFQPATATLRRRRAGYRGASAASPNRLRIKAACDPAAAVWAACSRGGDRPRSPPQSLDDELGA
jgi:cyclic pyranopterin phosphate synthase